ncbi:MAG: nucleotidyl transferase AbiEii/AbiGii toxin family protein [candidate division WOR-3 bacterium]|nr:nucleotidyl transferase AbiEii/AbiGii toxin family protein [candidate division WOR-3 bacterium]
MFDNVLPPESLGLLRDLNGELELHGFYLAGGTGLALQLGHRVSEDLDFFSAAEFDPALLARHLEDRPGYSETLVSKGTLYCRIAGVKLSFLHYPVPLKQPTVEYLSARVADWRDILAEKFKTVSQRGRRRDFYDIYACLTLKKLSVAEAVAALKDRFAGTGISYQHVLKNLTWFVDAETEPEPRLLMPADWSTVKRFFDARAAEFARYLS